MGRRSRNGVPVLWLMPDSLDYRLRINRLLGLIWQGSAPKICNSVRWLFSGGQPANRKLFRNALVCLHIMDFRPSRSALPKMSIRS